MKGEGREKDENSCRFTFKSLLAPLSLYIALALYIYELHVIHVSFHANVHFTLFSADSVFCSAFAQE
jgi:hypothetical protein